MAEQITGGLSPKEPANDEVKGYVCSVKLATEEKVGKNFGEFEAIAYRSQIVAGTNYFVKVKVGNGLKDYILLRIYVDLQNVVSLNGVLEDQSKDSPIDYFGPN